MPFFLDTIMASLLCIKRLSGRCLNDMMSRSGDLNINRSVQAFGDSTMERLKRAMLQHELIFRNQVCELHRLYWTQKNLMNELRVKVVDTWLSKESEEKKNVFSMFYQANERSLAQNMSSLLEFKGKSADLLKDHQTEFSFHISADDFIRRNGKVPAFYHQASKGIIDLESSLELEFREVTNDQVFPCRVRDPMQNGADMFGTQASVPFSQVSSSIIGDDQMASVIHLSEEHGGLLQEQKFVLSNVGIGDSCMDASVNQLRKKQQANLMLFDLNVPYEDDGSHDLKGTLEQGKNRSSPAETSFLPNPPLSDTLMIRHDKDSKSDCSLNSKLAQNTTACKNNIVSGCQMTQIQPECCDHGCLTINALSTLSMDLSKQAKDNLDSSADKLRSLSHSDIKRQDSNVTSSNSINLPQTINGDSVTKSTNHEGSEEDTSSSHAIAKDEISPSKKFLTECNSNGISRNNLSPNTDDSVTTQLNSPRNEGSLIGKLNPEECDNTIVSGAEVLMSILSGYSAFPNEQPDGVDASNLPQYSSDSFECLTLQLSEIESEDRRIMPEVSNANETGKNERGIRLRRGRGFRDFQKEILPGLVTLSRHEIFEDLHNSFKVRRENWFVPVRKRSKLCSGRPKRHSSS